MDDVLSLKAKKKKAKGQREEDLKDFLEDIIPTHTVSEEALDAFYGAGNWRQMPSETYKRLRHEPESWTVEVHTVDVFVGMDGGNTRMSLCAGTDPRICSGAVLPRLHWCHPS